MMTRDRKRDSIEIVYLQLTLNEFGYKFAYLGFILMYIKKRFIVGVIEEQSQ